MYSKLNDGNAAVLLYTFDAVGLIDNFLLFNLVHHVLVPNVFPVESGVATLLVRLGHLVHLASHHIITPAATHI